MPTPSRVSPTSEGAILSRLLQSLPPAAATALLDIRFEQGDLDRLHELVTKNQDDALTPAEKIELENYRRVSLLLDLMHSRARRSLKHQPERPAGQM
jgi:hypothetical protein